MIETHNLCYYCEEYLKDLELKIVSLEDKIVELLEWLNENDLASLRSGNDESTEEWDVEIDERTSENELQ